MIHDIDTTPIPAPNFAGMSDAGLKLTWLGSRARKDWKYKTLKPHITPSRSIMVHYLRADWIKMFPSKPTKPTRPSWSGSYNPGGYCRNRS